MSEHLPERKASLKIMHPIQTATDKGLNLQVLNVMTAAETSRTKLGACVLSTSAES